MSFTSLIYLFCFLPVCLTLYYLIQNNQIRNLFLLIASLLFYAWGEPRLVLLLGVTIVANYLFGLVINTEKKKTNKLWARTILILSLICNIGLLYYYKYLDLTVSSINIITGWQWPIPSLALPLGISFFTFRNISYLLDTYWDLCETPRSIVNAGLYISFFPQVLMGPITRFSEFESQLENRKTTLDDFREGIVRVVIGLSKKVILSVPIAVLADYAFKQSDAGRSVLMAWLGIIAYLMQLYFDFSGYSDMAIGFGRMLGFKTSENFDYPYTSKSVAEFWRKWHITLGAYFKAYVYTPVCRGLIGKQWLFTHKKMSIHQSDILALLVTWVIIGMWHGAGWRFLIHGLYYFVFIALERTLEYYGKKRRKQLGKRKKPETKLSLFGSHIYLLFVVCIGQVIFRAGSSLAAVNYIKSMFCLSSNSFADTLSIWLLQQYYVLLIVCIIFCIDWHAVIGRRVKNKNAIQNERRITEMMRIIALPILLVMCIALLVNTSYNPFLYLQF